jgi:hypothetical protein
MADEAHNSHHHPASDRGTMDLTDHMKTWLGFWAAVKWSSVGIIVIAILLAIFRTN